jgi:hypothetical protein
VHSKLQETHFSPHFHGAIGAIDETHILVVVPCSAMIAHFGRYQETTQNVLAVCDFDMRFTFVVAGWPSSVHDMIVFNEALVKYADKFSFPPECKKISNYNFICDFNYIIDNICNICVGNYYLVDSGYPNKKSFLSPYKGEKYHLPGFRQDPRRSGKKEVLNHLHSSLRRMIERAFGVLKEKWRILKHLPSYAMEKQVKIILACMMLHNFIRDSHENDDLFDMCDEDENFVLSNEDTTSSQSQLYGQEESDMNALRDSIANALMEMYQ